MSVESEPQDIGGLSASQAAGWFWLELKWFSGNEMDLRGIYRRGGQDFGLARCEGDAPVSVGTTAMQGAPSVGTRSPGKEQL